MLNFGLQCSFDCNKRRRILNNLLGLISCIPLDDGDFNLILYNSALLVVGGGVNESNPAAHMI